LSFGNKGEIDSPSDFDGYSEEVIYSQESPKRGENFKGFDWDNDRLVEYRSPLQEKLHYYLVVKVHWNITLQ
jgi:hypothetical protein